MPPRPHVAHLRRLSRAELWLGMVVGAGLSGIAIAWLLVANRLPSFDHLAMVRNIAAGILAVGLMLVPVCRFLKRPLHVFACGLTAWSILTLVYAILQLPFPRLATRMGTFHFFMLGALILGLASALLWVAQLVVGLCHEPAVPVRRAH